MGDKGRLLQEEAAAFAELGAAVAGLDEAQMGRGWLGAWGVREILIHVSGWHRETTAALERIARGERPHPEGVSYDDADAWNARFVDERRGVKAADVLLELDRSRRSFVAAAATVPEEAFAAGGAARDLFEGSGAGHYREHAGQIRRWRQDTGA